MPHEDRPPPGVKASHESGIRCKIHRIYSLTCDAYEALWLRSGGRCESCGELPGAGRNQGLVIDHDHRYGYAAVRGLICKWCNAALGQLEHPDVHAAFGMGGPGKWFDDYLSRAWFLGGDQISQTVDASRDREQFRDRLREWRKYNKALFSDDPQAALVPLNKPSVIAEILREEMSPQAFASLLRILNVEPGTRHG